MKIYLKNGNYEWQLYEGKDAEKRMKDNNIKLGMNVTLGDGVKLGMNVTLGDWVKLGNDVTLGDGVKLGNNVTLDDWVTLGNEVTLGDWVKLGNGVTLGDDVTLGDWVKLGNDYTMRDIIAGSLQQYPVKGKYIFYKKVNKISKGKYSSCYDASFLYEDDKISSVKDANMNKTASCASGIHVSTPFYWGKGNTLIQVEVALKDVITCLQGKIRCKKVKVIGEIK